MNNTEKLFNDLVNNDEQSAMKSFTAAIQDKFDHAMAVKRVAITSDVFNQSSVTESAEVEESNEFTKAAAQAKVDGKDEFEFDGKTYPSEMSLDAAKKILGTNESTDLEEEIEIKFKTAKSSKKEVIKFKNQRDFEKWFIKNEDDIEIISHKGLEQ